MIWQAYVIGYLVIGAAYAAHDLSDTERLKSNVEDVIDIAHNDPNRVGPALFSDSGFKWFVLVVVTLCGLLLWPIAMARDARRFIRRHRGGGHG